MINRGLGKGIGKNISMVFPERFKGVSIVFMTLMMFQGFSVFGKFVVSLPLPEQDLFLCVAEGMNIKHLRGSLNA